MKHISYASMIGINLIIWHGRIDYDEDDDKEEEEEKKEEDEKYEEEEVDNDDYAPTCLILRS
jgi:hypothetical protein